MSYIVCDELKTTLTQTINLKYDRVYQIAGIKINVLMYNAPSGTFTLSVKSGVTTLASANFTSADIKSDLSTSDNYAYIYKALNIELPLKKGSYDLVLSSSGYTYDKASFLGWIKSHENIFNSQETVATTFVDNPFDVLIYEKMREDLVK